MQYSLMLLLKDQIISSSCICYKHKSNFLAHLMIYINTCDFISTHPFPSYFLKMSLNKTFIIAI